MSEPWPGYFTRLEPFRELFATGAPLLTYHKFGRRPPGVRLKGLYLPTRLLETQLSELSKAGLTTVGITDVIQSPPGRAVGLTIDDGFRSVHQEALPALARHGCRATLYLVADRLGGWNDWEQAQGEVAAPLMNREEVREWLGAGHWIGAHTLTHPWLTRIPVSQAREEIGASRRRLEDWFQIPVTDFCYPYGDWNRAVRELVIEAGYRTAVTTDFGVNRGDTDRWSLRRVTARHRSRNFRSLVDWWRRWRSGGAG